jgi:hypothetical protein
MVKGAIDCKGADSVTGGGGGGGGGGGVVPPSPDFFLQAVAAASRNINANTPVFIHKLYRLWLIGQLQFKALLVLNI